MPLLARLALVAALALLATPALAHSGHDAGLLAGFLHPLLGPDHLAAMLAIGLWAAQPGPLGGLRLPGAFLAGMALGIGGGLAGLSLGSGGEVLPGIEAGVAASVLVLGVLVAIAVPVPPGLALPAVGLAGLLHGLAHGGEIGGLAAATACGMLAGSALLHAAGFLAGRAAARSALAGRAAGGAIAAFGAVLLLG